MPKLKNTPEQNLTIQLKIAMLEKGWNQKHLAKICGMEEAQMSRVINKPRRCNYSTICTVAEKLGIDSLPVI